MGFASWPRPILSWCELADMWDCHDPASLSLGGHGRFWIFQCCHFQPKFKILSYLPVFNNNLALLSFALHEQLARVC